MKDDADSILNPHGAAYRENMVGWTRFHYSTYGERLIAFYCFGVRLDLYRSKPSTFFYSRISNAGTLFMPFGSLTWPMPDRAPQDKG